MTRGCDVVCLREGGDEQCRGTVLVESDTDSDDDDDDADDACNDNDDDDDRQRALVVAVVSLINL